MSKRTINTSFFDQLWPLILEENICDTRSKNTTKFFEPVDHFDYLWAHEFLAKKKYKNYQKPKELRLPRLPGDETTGSLSSKVSQLVMAEEEDKDEINCIGQLKPKIPTLEEQSDRLRLQRERSQRLAYEYINRKYPWYMERSSYQYDFEIADEMRAKFSNSFEMDILENMKSFHCKLIVIDVAPDISINEMERWIKFSEFALIVVVTRCETMAHKLGLLKGAFCPICMQENLENSWQEELSQSLNLAKDYGKKKGFELDCGNPFVFVFATKQSAKTWDTFKVLRRI